MRKSIVRELIIGFGFLNGLWVAVGISPEEWVYNFLKAYINNMPAMMKTIFVIIPTILMILTLITVFKTYQSGKLLGLISVGLAFVAGTLIFANYITSGILLAIALILGAIGFRRRERQLEEKMIGYYKFHENLDAMRELYIELEDKFSIEKYRSNKDIADSTMEFLKKNFFLRLSVVQSEYELQSISPKLYKKFDECFEILVGLEKKCIDNNE